jgi:hypothetical protein
VQETVGTVRRMAISYEWRSEFGSSELNALHAAAFGTRVFTDEEWNWRELVTRHSLGWVSARDGGDLAGFLGGSDPSSVRLRG